MKRVRALGVATIEFVVLCLALAPLFVLMPLVGKLLDMALATESAARYAAFQGIVRNDASPAGWTSDDDLALDIRRRFFGAPGVSIKTGDAAGDADSDRNPLWRDAAAAPLLASFDDVAAASGRDREPGFKVIGAQQVIEAYRGPLSLETATLNVGRVQAAVAPFDLLTYGTPWGGLELRFDRSVAILVDGWPAPSRAIVGKRIHDGGASVFPYTPLQIETSALTPLVRLTLDPSGKLAELGGLDPAMPVGSVDASVIPCDRFGAGNRPAVCR